MIYIGKVRPSIMEPPIEKSIIKFFKEYDPPKVIVPDDEAEQKKLKTMGIDGFIAGEMKALIRKNENLISRDCLILDLDDVIVSEIDLIDAIKQKLGKFAYVLYPSVSHGLKGVRYRLVIPLDKPVNEQDYKILIYFFSNKILDGIIHNADQSNLTWSQIQLLPVLTKYIKEEQIIIHDEENLFPISDGLGTAKRWLKDYKQDTGGVTSRKLYKNTSQFKKGGSRYRNTTTELFESLVAGCEEGNRNNRIAQITGGLLARAVDVSAVFELVKVANQYFTEPLSEEEIEATFFSIANKELKAN
ncbi:primase alpha helix C-terminal domain-containing protein [Enterococcus raffinosus]|uniref:Primase alpha helix C-terminal domain-containing protein n=1 Tax=Enterococcus raffinosus TaxID=71452 RepID=A0AAW8TA32_9ENTE|nr:primase alpha helix C-terminal domain-containing protein [Enterococcus raffinosus]MDT2524928.1 primase alpha helix C-terminal domain-containing protein [Enterococcus raffinosus]MDT2535645.1 primase alpha helix C-terminal domain-containing protein [Enterococcus raffinosus]MDT2546025.1 primase alpha helix C-terminal domain-containing protein [Enterococcus raffinosus]MDT2592322.1 primase alpha helix C-terminal domain-containing protein [Enterococcus raffinosus]